MLISTKGRYALRVMIDLAEHYNGNYIPMKEVAARQEISLKYLEKILPVLTRASLIEGVHGKGGGYKLVREPDQYTVWEILCLAEGDLVPVSCLEEGTEPCTKAAECRTFPMWVKLDNMIRDFFNGISLTDLMQNDAGGDNYVI